MLRSFRRFAAVMRLCLALAAGVLAGEVARATPVVWAPFPAIPPQGKLDPGAIPLSTGTGEVRYSNVNLEGYDIVITTNRLTQGGGVTFGSDYAWYFAGTVPTDSTYATITIRYYLTGTYIPFGVTGADLLLEDAEIYERLGSFSIFDDFGNQIPVLFNAPMFAYSQGPFYSSNYTQVANDSPQEGGSQAGKEIEGNMKQFTITGYTFGLHRQKDTAGDMLMMSPGNISEAPIVQWRQNYFGNDMATPAIAGDGASPALDGIPNLLKYAFGLDPTHREPLSSLPRVYLNQAGLLEISFNRVVADTDITYIVETSSDLVHWIEGSTYSAAGEYGIQGQTVQVSNTLSNGVESIVVDDTVPITSGSPRFMRIRITRP